MEFQCKTLADTTDLGAKLGAQLQKGDVVGLMGPLGVGKTTFVSGMAKGLGLDNYAVTSPTFVFAHIYDGKVPLYHMDLYRIEKESEIHNIGLEEMIGGEGVAAIEWMDRFPTVWSGDQIVIRMQYGEGQERKIQMEGKGERFKKIVNGLENRR